MKVLISTLGYNTSQVVSFLVKDGIEAGDKIIILRPKRDPENKGKQAYENTKNLVHQISPEIEIMINFLDTSDFNKMIETIADLFAKEKGEMVVNISGGSREIIIALTIVVMFFRNKIARIYNVSDTSYQIRQLSIPSIVIPIVGNEHKILKSVLKGKKTYNELAKQLKVSKSTISRITTELYERGLVKLIKKGKEHEVEITTAGKLILQVS